MAPKKPAEVTLAASALRDLLAPVLPLASTASDSPILHAVRIESCGEWLTASATDRFRLGVARVRPDVAPPKGIAATVPLPTAKRILALFKPTRHVDPELTLTFRPDAIAVRGNGLFGDADFNTTWPLVPGDYPLVRNLFHKHPPATVAEPLALNPTLLGDFRHAQRFGEPIVLVPTGPNQSVLVAIGDDFRGLIQPMRGGGTAMFADGWDVILPAPASDATAVA